VSNVDVLNLFTEPNMINYFTKMFEIYADLPDIIEEIIWILGNVVGSNKTGRDIVIKSGIFNIVYNIVQKERVYEDVVKVSIWFMANCLNVKPLPDEDVLKKAAEIFILFAKTGVEEVMIDCLTGIFSITESETPIINRAILESGIIQYLYNLDIQHNRHILHLTLRLTGNLLAMENAIADVMISFGCINFLDKFLFDPQAQFRKECLWALSNISAGSKQQILFLFNSGIIKKIFLLCKDLDFNVVQEAVFIISNITYNSNFDMTLQLVDFNILEIISELINNTQEVGLLKFLLSSLDNILRKGANTSLFKDNPFAKSFLEKGGIDILENLQNYKNEDIADYVTNILNNYFNY
jgi:hypothetical protein